VTIDLELLPEEFRLQRVLYLTVRKAMEQLESGYPGGRDLLIQQLVRLVETFMDSDRLEIPSLFHQEPLRKRILFALAMDTLVGQVVAQIQQQNIQHLEPVFDAEFPIGSTRLMRTWYTTKPCLTTVKSQISHAVADSTWEHYTATHLEQHPEVAAYAKNDHLGLHIFYLWRGSKRRFTPDYLIRFTNGKQLILEIKGEDSDQNRSKRQTLDTWVRAVNARGGFGTWCWDVVKAEPSKLMDVLVHHSRDAASSPPIGEAVLSVG